MGKESNRHEKKDKLCRDRERQSGWYGTRGVQEDQAAQIEADYGDRYWAKDEIVNLEHAKAVGDVARERRRTSEA